MLRNKILNILLLIGCSLLLSVFLQITPAQSQATKEATIQLNFQNKNTVYNIDSIIDLRGGMLNIPDNSTLCFTSGKILNGTVTFNNTNIENPRFENCRFYGSVVESDFSVIDYGVLPNKNMDCSVIINDLVNLKIVPTSNNNPKTLYFPKGTYYIDNPIELFAGYESPVTIKGVGNMSTICQRHDNDYIIKIYEQNHIRDIRLTYQKRQPSHHSRSVAIACQRSTFSIFENITICKAHTGFGYISQSDMKHGYNPTGSREQCFVSDNFRNIRVYEFSGYAFDFKKEVDLGDSGSVYDNIYISSDDWLSKTTDNISQGAIRLQNTIASFTQLNIEGHHYSNTLIEMKQMSRMNVLSLHLEWIENMPLLLSGNVHSLAHFDLIDIQSCSFNSDSYPLFDLKDKAMVDIAHLGIRSDCKLIKRTKNQQQVTLSTAIHISNIIDPIYLISK